MEQLALRKRGLVKEKSNCLSRKAASFGFF